MPAENVTLNSGGGGGAVIASDDIGSVHFQRIKLVYGPDSTNRGDVDIARPLPTSAPHLRASAALGALNAAVTLDLSPAAGPHHESGTVTWEIDTGTLVGTVTPEATLDDTNWFAIDAIRIDGTVIASTTTFDDRGSLTSTGYSQVRLRVSAFTSGTSNARMSATAGSNIVRVVATSLVDAGNSTTTPLGSSATFTGAGVDTLNYSAVTVQIFADQIGAVDGLTFEFSEDNSNWDVKHSINYDTINDGRHVEFALHAKFFRVVFINGGVAQGAFRLHTILHRGPPFPGQHRLDENLSPDHGAGIIKSVLHAQSAGVGDFIPIASTAAGNLKVSVQELSDGLDIGAGNAGAETLRVSISTDDVNLSAIKTAVEISDNVVNVPDTAISSVTALGAQFDDAATATVVEDNIAALRINAARALHAILPDVTGTDGAAGPASAISIAGTNAGNLQEIAVNTGGEIILDALPPGAGLNVNLDTILTVALSVDVGIPGTGSQRVVLASALHSGVDTGGPQKIGMKAIDHGVVTAVDANDRTDWYANRDGVPWVIGGHPNIVTETINTTALRTDQEIVAAAAGQRLVVTRLSITTDASVTVDTRVVVGFAAATLGTPVFGGVTGILHEHPGVPGGGGITIGDGSGIIGIGAAGEDLRYTNSVPTGGSLTISVSYYEIDST